MRRREITIILALSTLSFLYFYFFINRSLSIYDEGYVLEASRMFLKGKLPFRDFFYQYPPLTVWLGGLWFRIVGTGIINLRLLALLISVVSVVLGYLIARRLVKPLFAVLISLSFAAWGFPHANFLWPTAVATFLLLLIIFLFIKFEETQKEYFLFLAGIAVVLSIFNKQNIGIANLVGGLFYVFYLKAKNKVKIRNFFYGIISSATIGVILLGFDSQTLAGMYELVQRSTSVVLGDAFIFPYTIISNIEPGFYELFKWAGKSFIYLYPIFLIALSAFFALTGRVKKNLWNLIFFLTSLHFLAVVWPLADLAHLTFAIPAVILATSSLFLLDKPFLKKLSYFSLIILTFMGFYKTFFMRYYTFETPYFLQKEKVTIEGKTFYVDKKHKVIVENLENLKNTMFMGKSVFVHPYVPMFYYLLDKDSPTYDLYTVSSLLSEKAMQRTISELEEKKVDLVIIEPWREKHLYNEITNYVTQNYKEVGGFWDYEVYERDKITSLSQ